MAVQPLLLLRQALRAVGVLGRLNVAQEHAFEGAQHVCPPVALGLELARAGLLAHDTRVRVLLPVRVAAARGTHDGGRVAVVEARERDALPEALDDDVVAVLILVVALVVVVVTGRLGPIT